MLLCHSHGSGTAAARCWVCHSALNQRSHATALSRSPVLIGIAQRGANCAATEKPTDRLYCWCIFRKWLCVSKSHSTKHGNWVIYCFVYVCERRMHLYCTLFINIASRNAAARTLIGFLFLYVKPEVTKTPRCDRSHASNYLDHSWKTEGGFAFTIQKAKSYKKYWCRSNNSSKEEEKYFILMPFFCIKYFYNVIKLNNLGFE